MLIMALVLGLGLLLFTSVDITPYRQTAYYQPTMARLSSGSGSMASAQGTGPLLAGWAKVNITPAQSSPLAGYGISRSGFQQIHDSLYIRVIYLEKDQARMAIVSADLAVFPPAVVAALPEVLAGSGVAKQHIYWVATHTHNGTGGWAEHPAGYLLAGKYDKKMVDGLAQAVTVALGRAQQLASPAQIGYGEVAVPAFVHHRLLDGGRVDAGLRLLKIVVQSGQTAVFAAYQAHPTCTDPTVLEVGRDYPGYLVDALEQSGKVEFAMFGAGMVASHAPHWDGPGEGYPMAKRVGEGLAQAALPCLDTLSTAQVKSLGIWHLPVDLGEAQLRITDRIRVRSSVFDALFGQRDLWINVLKINGLRLIGTPCDFSGELMAELAPVAQRMHKELLITSFNGGYTGYITPDHYYNTLHAPEIREMNWVGPGKGGYFLEMIESMIEKF